MKFYKFDLNLQIFRELGFRFANPKIFALVKAYVKPLAIIKADIEQMHDRLRDEMSFSCSTIVVEKMLNDLFDQEARQIRIEDRADVIFHSIVRRQEETEFITGPGEDTLIVRREEELGDTIDPQYNLVRREEEMSQNLSFLVVVNNDISYDRDLMISRVNRYRTSGKTWGILNSDTEEIFKITQFQITE